MTDVHSVHRMRGRPSRLGSWAAVVSGAIFLSLGLSTSATSSPDASAGNGAARPVQVLESERTGVVSPVGIAFAGASGSFYVVPGGRAAAPEVVTLQPFAFDPTSDRAGSARLAATIEDPINTAFDARRSRLLLLGHAGELLEVPARPDGGLDARALSRRSAARLGLRDPQGMAVDPESGALFVLDASQPRIVRVDPGPDGSFDKATTSVVDLLPSGLSDLRGIAFDPSTGHLHVRSGSALHELTTAGTVVAVRDLSAADLVSPQGMVFAPSGDQTDAPDRLSVYVADDGQSSSRAAKPTAGTGQIVELTFDPAVTIEAATFTSTLVRTTDMAAPAFSPPSPDPSGIGYIAAKDRLIMSDGEVEEVVNGITHFQGANVWEMNRDGSVIRSANISKVAYQGTPSPTPMTDEPTGVAYRGSNGHYFFTEDGGKRVYDLNPGADGLVGTAGDTWTYFTTSGFGNTDPEGIAYDSFNDRLFVADGTNREIYQYTPSGSLVGHFDTQVYGVEDPETVEFNSVTGTLFVLSNRQSGPIIIETTTTGDLLQTIAISGVYIHKPAGLAYAPASDGSGAMRFYVVDRGIDNNNDPNIIDGKMFELTAPAASPPGNQPPVVSAGSDLSVTLPAAATLDGTVTDDGLPAPPSLTTTWTKLSGPGTVTFGDATAVDTTAGFSVAGTYTLRLTAFDGALSAFDDVVVTVNPPPGPATLYFSVGTAQTIGGVPVTPQDIVAFDGTSFSLFVDGSDVGLDTSGETIDAFTLLSNGHVLVSTTGNPAVPGLSGKDEDVLELTPTSLGDVTSGTWSMYFDGSIHGLESSGEDVDAFELLDDGRLLVSTTGLVSVPGVSGEDEDVLAFTPGPNTWEMYFDGTDVGLTNSGEDVDAVAVDAAGRLYLSTVGNFAVAGVSGADEDVFVFTPQTLGSTTTGTFSSTLFFDGSALGLAANDVFALDLP